MKMLYRHEEVEVIETSGSLVRVRYKNGDESNWFKATLLKDITVPKVSLTIWVGLKSQPSSGDSRRNRSGHLTEHTQALRDNIAFDIEQATLKADQKPLTGEVETPKQ